MDTVTTLVNNSPQLKAVYETFVDYYGEDKVDIRKEGHNYQGYSYAIYVYWPEVTISNEYDESVNIKKLYARVEISGSGRLIKKFEINRANYPLTHLISDYQHSHTPGVPWDNLSLFRAPCTGSGPINKTISSLMVGYNDAMWKLFCRELDVYVHVESVAGGPYRRLSRISRNGSSSSSYRCNLRKNIFINLDDRYCSSESTKYLTKEFIKYLCSNNLLKFRYVDGVYTLAEPQTKFNLKLSGYFIQWINQIYKNHSIPMREESVARPATLMYLQCEYDQSTGEYYTMRTSRSRRDPEALKALDGRILFTFKDKDVKLEVEDDMQNDDNHFNYLRLLKPEFIDYVVSIILKYINFYYGKKY